MEKPQICEEKTDRNRLSRVNFTYKTVNSAGSCIFLVQIYRFEGNSVKYTDPDGMDIIYQDSNGNEKGRQISERNEIHTPESDKALMDANAATMRDSYLDLRFFYNQVNKDGPWDFKNKPSDEYRSHYWFNNDLIPVEEFGNIHYGYVGKAG
jgi:hypothetical protein